MPEAGTDNRASGPAARKRITREEREQAIVDGAIAYFADVGFKGQMRTLAEQVGVSQALLFKHFVNKDALIERVYQEVYLKRWNPLWESILEDTRLSGRERLIRFYESYVETAKDHQWIRIFMYASLSRHEINKRYLSLIGERIIPKICVIMREASDASAPSALSEAETQAAWGLHGSILYYLIQLNIYENGHPDARFVVRSRVDAFYYGASGHGAPASSGAGPR